MKSVIKNRFLCMQKFIGAILCIVFFVASSCGNSSFEEDFQQTSIIYPETGKYGLNILAEGFVEGISYENGRYVEYSVRSVPARNANLKIVIKSAKPEFYVCRNSSPLCDAIFYEWHEICPVCGVMNTLHKQLDRWMGVFQGYEENWVVSSVDFDFLSNTWTIWKSGKSADAKVQIENDFIIEYYENWATEPTKVKEVKVIDYRN